MHVSRRIVTMLFGLMIAGVIGRVIAVLSLAAGVIVFALLSVFWSLSIVSFAHRQVEARGGRLGAFADPQQWTPEGLLLEFRFITHNTAMDQVVEKIGPLSK